MKNGTLQIGTGGEAPGTGTPKPKALDIRQSAKTSSRPPVYDGAAEARHIPQSPVPNPERGFTFLEILIALVLMAFAMVGVWGALRTGAKLSRSADASMQQSDRVRAVQQFLRDYLGGAQPQAYAPAAEQSARMFEGAPQKLTWVAPMPAQLGAGGLFVQTLQLVRDKSDADYTLQLTYAPMSGDGVNSQAAQSETLLDHVADAHFEYLVPAGNGRPARWRGTWQNTSGLPLAVRITLQPAWPERVAFPPMSIPLRAGNGFSVGGPVESGAQQ